MLKLKKIAVTGGVATGKTTVCKLFKKLGAYVVSADEIVHQILSQESTPNTLIKQKIVALLGEDIIHEKQLDRKKIAKRVFSNPSMLFQLEQILHPFVFEEIQRLYEIACEEKKYKLFIAEIPLLFETKSQCLFDSVVTVVADESLCRERFMQDHEPDEFDKRMQRQLFPGKKADQSHYIIENNGSEKQLKTNVQALYSQLTKG